MESLQFLMSGFAIALQPTNLVFAFIGCILGTLVGVIPGFGSASAMAMLIPVSFGLEATPAVIMLAAIFYGAQYGGTITSVLVNVPGEATSAITCLEGYPMARQGRAGTALAIAALGSFVGGTLTTVVLVLVALPLTRIALRLGPPELFALMVMALSLVAGLTGKSMVRGGVSASLGLLIGSVGVDPVVGAPRFTFGQVDLMDGFGMVPVVMGLFGVGEILINAENPVTEIVYARLDSLVPTRQDLKDSLWPMLRGTVIGFFCGIVPGVGVTISTILSYAIEKKVSRTPEKFGTGMIQGVAGPETANNACANAHLIPLFGLGLPTTATMAILLGAFMMNGLTPGPFLFRQHPDFVWAVIASLYIGNVMLLILNLPLIPMWVAVLKIPYSILFALILAFVVVGAYTLNGALFDVGSVLAFGVLGYAFRKLDIPVAPLVMTLVLTPMMERALRRSLEMSQGDLTIFFTRPIAITFLAIAILFLVGSLFSALSRVRKSAAAQETGTE